MAQDSQRLVLLGGGAALLFFIIVGIAVLSARGGGGDVQEMPTFSRRVSECSRFLYKSPEDENLTTIQEMCEIRGKRISINPDKIPYNFSEVILWTLDNGNTIRTMQDNQMEDDGAHCYVFDRLDKVLATEVMAKQRWKAVRLKQKFDRNRYKNFSGTYSEEDLFIAKGGSEKEIYVPEEGADTGLFASVLQAYKNHWVLRTSPDDWFFPVIRRIAQVVDENALKPEVQRYLGNGNPKTELKVQFNKGFEAMFEELSQQVSRNLVTSEYAKVFEANFSTTTSTDRLVSQLILMSSVQKYFNFDTYIACGIPEIELLGSEQDWRSLLVKLDHIRKVLNPISDSLGNITHYLTSIVKPVYTNLLETYLGRPNQTWWNDIVLKQSNVEQVCTKLRKVVERWDGWLVGFLNGEEGQEMRDIASGLLTVPLKVENSVFNLEYPATLVAGQIGFTLYEEEVTVVEPYAGWAMLITQEIEDNNRRRIMEIIRHRRRERQERRRQKDHW